MKYLLVSLLSTLIFFNVKNNDPKDQQLYLIVENGLYGYMNAEGKVIIRPQFANAQQFSEGLAAVRKDGYYGYIDNSGQFVIPPQYEFATAFKEDFAIVFNDKTPFFIDKKGLKPFNIDKIINIDKVIKFNPFKKGLSIVITKDGQGLINKRGQWILKPEYKYITIYDNNWYKVVQTKDRGSHTEGVIDKTGKWIIPLGIYTSIENFQGDYAQVAILEDDDDIKVWSGKEGWIDRDGKLVFSLVPNEKIQGFGSDVSVQDGIFIVRLEKPEKGVKRSREWEYVGLMNLKGELLLDSFHIKRLRLLDNGLYKAEDKDSKIWFINNRGKQMDDSNRWRSYRQKDNLKSEEDVKKIGELSIQHDGDFSSYLNEEKDVVWQEKENSRIDTLDIDYMNRGSFYAASESKSIENNWDLLGWGRSKNKDKQIEAKIRAAENAFSVIAKTYEPVNVHDGKVKGFKVYIVNNSQDTVFFMAQDSRLSMNMQALDKSGKWQDIEYLPSSWCGNSYHTLALDPQRLWEFSAPFYKGSFKTQLRFKLLYKETKGRGIEIGTGIAKELEVYSNEFLGSVNPGQFWRKSGYSPNGLMDPYND
jgi:hypothetical protein